MEKFRNREVLKPKCHTLPDSGECDHQFIITIMVVFVYMVMKIIYMVMITITSTGNISLADKTIKSGHDWNRLQLFQSL